MGKELYGKYEAARLIFDDADRLLGYSISKLCFEGPEESLTETSSAQTAIFVTSIAMLRVIQSRKPNFCASVVCGLSLGEFSALVAAEVFTFEKGLKLVRKRGELMKMASQKNQGTMASILGLSQEVCQKICSDSGAEMANLNSPDQIVVSGTHEAVLKCCELAESEGGKTIPLKVSGAFHSRLMVPAKEGLRRALTDISLGKPRIAFIPNVLGDIVDEPNQIRELLGEQVTSSVQWVKTMATLERLGVTQAFEIGPGRVLKGLAKRNKVKFDVVSLESDGDLEQFLNQSEERVC